MKKYFVLDTNVLLVDPEAIFGFGDNHVVLPIWIIEEIDKFKRDQTELGRNARQTSRLLDELRKKGKLSEGVKLDSGGTVKVDLGDGLDNDLPAIIQSDVPDSHIVSVALKLKKNNKRVIFVTRDSNLRIKADSLGIDAVDFESQKVSFDELYSGAREILTASENVDSFYRDSSLKMEGEFIANEGVILVDDTNPKHSALSRYDNTSASVVPLRFPESGVWGISPRNMEQRFAMDLLMNEKLNLVTLVGKAGTGKTLLAIATGLAQTADSGVYNRLLVTRPVLPMGKDLGYLPGELEEKMRPWMQPIFDNLEFILGKSGKRGYEELMYQKILEVEALSYIRGRSLPGLFLIVDEAQNLTPHEVKTIITRAGENTKIVLTGDPYQIDHPYLDSSSNGLCYAVERFKGHAIAGHITLRKGERSGLAELAANIL